MKRKWSLFAVGLFLLLGAIGGALFNDMVKGATYGLLLGSIIYGFSRKRA